MEQKLELLFEKLGKWNKSKSYCSKNWENGTKAQVIVRKFKKMKQKQELLFEKLGK